MIITVHVKPAARTNSCEWIDEDTAKISIIAAPEKGKANKAVIDMLAKELGIPKTSINIIRGSTAKIKQFEIQS